MKAFMARWQLRGGTLALVWKGRLVYSQGFGLADSSLPAQPRQLFRIASLSKPLTALAILQLQQQGRLKLSDKVFGPKGLLPYAAYPFTDRRLLQVTVQQLLQHTAGWDRHLNVGGDPMFNPVHIAREMGVPAPADAATIIRYVLKRPLDFSPGSRYAYSNFGYALLGRVIEQLSGMSYEAYVQEQVLYPAGILGMRLARNSYADKEAAEVRYFEDPGTGPVPSFLDPGQLVPWPYGAFNIEAMDAHGGWVASAEDLARLLAALDGLPRRPDLFPGDVLQQLQAGSGPNPGYGLGWMVNSRGARWHTGSLPGTSAMMAQLPSGLSWVLLFNGRHDSQAYFEDLDQLMWRALPQLGPWPAHDLFADPVLADGALPNPEAPAYYPGEAQP
ncbi:MAG: serine hydrolase domain-containing protein [Adhaeribacter sp.]